MDRDQRAQRNRRISRAAEASARSRTCPACGRGGALTRHVDRTGYLGSVVTCRWCPYERVHEPIYD